MSKKCMYNTNYECRYHKNDIFLETDKVNDDEQDYIRNILYREDLLNIFNISEEDKFDNITEILSKMYLKLKNCLELKNIMYKIANKFLSEDEEFGLCILYSYDYMYLTHKCVCHYLENKNISDNLIMALKDKITS